MGLLYDFFGVPVERLTREVTQKATLPIANSAESAIAAKHNISLTKWMNERNQLMVGIATATYALFDNNARSSVSRLCKEEMEKQFITHFSMLNEGNESAGKSAYRSITDIYFMQMPDKLGEIFWQRVNGSEYSDDVPADVASLVAEYAQGIGQLAAKMCIKMKD